TEILFSPLLETMRSRFPSRVRSERITASAAAPEATYTAGAKPEDDPMRMVTTLRFRQVTTTSDRPSPFKSAAAIAYGVFRNRYFGVQLKGTVAISQKHRDIGRSGVGRNQIDHSVVVEITGRDSRGRKTRAERLLRLESAVALAQQD